MSDRDPLPPRVWGAALRQAAPVILGYVPIGFAYGVLAQKAGLSAGNALLMSLLVYAGSAQLIAVGLFGAGAAPLSIIATTFVVNLRHLLMAAALAPAMRRWSRRQLALFGFELTDESFAVHSSRFPEGAARRGETLLINLFAQCGWVGGSALGLVASGLIRDVRPVGLDYALPAMFIALLVLQCSRAPLVRVAIFSGLASVVLQRLGLTEWHVILATLLGASYGVMEERWRRR